MSIGKYGIYEKNIMKIALVLERFNIARGGAERSTYEMACALTDLGMDITLIAGDIIHKNTDNLPFRILPVPIKGVTPILRWHHFEDTVADCVSDNRFDVVHAMVPIRCCQVYQPRGGSLLNSARRHAASYGCPILYRLKLATAWLNRTRQKRIDCERALCRHPDGPIVAALSDYVVQQFKTDYLLPDTRIRLIRNGIDTAAICNGQARADGQKLRQLYDRNQNLALFLFTAENLRLKGLPWLLKAAQLAFKKRPDNLRDFRIMIVSSYGYKKYWLQAQRMGLNQKILFMGQTSQMPALLHMCDGVVLPTYNDACSRIVLEALAAGTPAITTRFNGAADFLTPNQTGHIIEHCDDTESLANALLALCDAQIQQSMAQTIQTSQLHQQISMQRHGQELIELYREISHAKR